MNSQQELQKKVMLAARDNGISSILFRNAIGRKLGLSVADSECLSFLATKETSTPSELARYTGMTSGAATAMLDRLEKAKLITRKPNPNDRRGSLVQISPLYGQMAGPLVAGVQKAQAELIASYSAEELQIIADFLTRFTSNVSDQTKIIEAL